MSEESSSKQRLSIAKFLIAFFPLGLLISIVIALILYFSGDGNESATPRAQITQPLSIENIRSSYLKAESFPTVLSIATKSDRLEVEKATRWIKGSLNATNAGYQLSSRILETYPNEEALYEITAQHSKKEKADLTIFVPITESKYALLEGLLLAESLANSEYNLAFVFGDPKNHSLRENAKYLHLTGSSFSPSLDIKFSIPTKYQSDSLSRLLNPYTVNSTEGKMLTIQAPAPRATDPISYPSVQRDLELVERIIITLAAH